MIKRQKGAEGKRVTGLQVGGLAKHRREAVFALIFRHAARLFKTTLLLATGIYCEGVVYEGTVISRNSVRCVYMFTSAPFNPNIKERRRDCV